MDVIVIVAQCHETRNCAHGSRVQWCSGVFSTPSATPSSRLYVIQLRSPGRSASSIRPTRTHAHANQWHMRRSPIAKRISDCCEYDTAIRDSQRPKRREARTTRRSFSSRSMRRIGAISHAEVSPLWYWGVKMSIASTSEGTVEIKSTSSQPRA